MVIVVIVVMQAKKLIPDIDAEIKAANDKREEDVADVEQLKGLIVHRMELLQKLANGALEMSHQGLHDNCSVALQDYKAALE